MIKNIIFDLSEVLLPGQWGIEHEIARIEGLDVKTVDDALFNEKFFQMMKGELSECEYSRYVIESQGWPITIDDLKDITRENFYSKEYGVKELLPKLKENYRLILLSDNCKEWIEYIRENYSFIDLFDSEYYSYELGHMKQEIQPFETVLYKEQILPEETAFVDDSKTNVDIARKHGIKGVVFHDIEQLHKDFNELGIEIDTQKEHMK